MVIPIEIVDMNEVPTFVKIDGPVETNELDQVVMMDFSLLHPSALATEISYETVNGSALGGEDYVSTAGVLVLPRDNRGVKSPSDCLTIEFLRSRKSLTYPYQFLGQPSSAMRITVRIDDDEAPPVISLSPPFLPESAGNPYRSDTLSHPTSMPLTLSIESANASAEAGQDFEIVDEDFTFSAGQTGGNVSVTLLNDLSYEETETFRYKGY